MISREILSDVSGKNDPMDSTFRGTIYSTTWLNLSLPTFTTSQYALVSLEVPLALQSNERETITTARATKLYSELSCCPAKVVDGDFEQSSNAK